VRRRTLWESEGFLVVLTVFKTVVAASSRGEAGSIPALSVSRYPLKKRAITRACPARFLFQLLLLLSVAAAPTATADTATEPPKSRCFNFTYAGAVKGLQPGRRVRLWLPVPPDNDDQHVERVARQLPANPDYAVESKAGNRILFLESGAPADGRLPFSVTYRVIRKEVVEKPSPRSEDIAPYLRPDALVPIGGKPANTLLALHRPLKDQLAEGHWLYDLVDSRMQYRKDRPGWGRGDAAWACDSRFGNCTDFHSLFMSLARTEGIPVKFEIGFPIPPKPGGGEVKGYHCWAKFKPAGHGWVPVDISEANKDPTKRDYYFGHLCENRVSFSTGRDLVLVPKQDGPPLNFFIYPYAEVGGKSVPQEQIEHACRFEDVSASQAKEAHK
jgi:transglutaminase-like putative cysteine protease